MAVRTIDSKALLQLINSNPNLILLDVRDEDKFQAGSLQVAGIKTRNQPYLRMRDQVDVFDESTAHELGEAEIVTICTTGNKASKAAELLREQGYRACSLEGGLTAWNAGTSGVKE